MKRWAYLFVAFLMLLFLTQRWFRWTVAIFLVFLLSLNVDPAEGREPMIEGEAPVASMTWPPACPDEPGPGAGANPGGPFASGDLTQAERRWEPLLAQYFCHYYAVEEAMRIVACESNGDSNVVNPASGTTGLFQIHPLWFDHPEMGNPYDPEDNVAFAHWLWLDADGWDHWACRPVP